MKYLLPVMMAQLGILLPDAKTFEPFSNIQVMGIKEVITN